MVRIVSDFVLKSRFKKKLKLLTSVSKSNKKQLKSIAILISGNYEVKEHLYIAFAKSFKVPAKNITIVVFNKNKILLQNTTLGQRIECSKEMIDFWGNFPEIFNDFFKKEFDLLINYFDDNSLLTSYVSVFCKAKLRVGFFSTQFALNDLIINVNPLDTDLFLSESTKYLKSILK